MRDRTRRRAGGAHSQFSSQLGRVPGSDSTEWPHTIASTLSRPGGFRAQTLGNSSDDVPRAPRAEENGQGLTDLVTGRTKQKLQGKLTALNGDSLLSANAVVIERAVKRLADRAEGAQSRRPTSHDRIWIRRHPALFGALVGAGVGSLSSVPRWTEWYCATGGDEDCVFHGTQGVLFGAGVGAGIGALFGFLVSL